MQWYFSSLLILLSLIGLGALTGNLLLVWLPVRIQPSARVFLAVPFGWALLTLIATLAGWFGPGYAECHCAILTFTMAAIGAWTGRRWLHCSGNDCLKLLGFCILASFPTLGSLLRIGSFSLYNDTYLYSGQALWLQQHGFLEVARTEGGHPAWATVILMQSTSQRIGASFLLGWVDAMFGLETPYEVFPVVAALGVICGALGVGATMLAVCPQRRLEAWLTALATAVTLNGFPFGASHGFLPQTWGLAFASAVFGLRGLEISTRRYSGGAPNWRTGIPLGICTAASMHCYWELLPLEWPALACSYLLPFPGWNMHAWKEKLLQISAPLLTCLLLVNIEWVRAVRGISVNIQALVANPVAWTVWSFPAHALGLKSSVWERGRWITHDPSIQMLFVGCVVVILWLCIWLVSQPLNQRCHWWQLSHQCARWQWQPLIPAFTWIVISIILFVYFRYMVPSPWHGRAQGEYLDGLGQSWSQYKITIWASFSVICLVVGLGTGSAIYLGFQRWRVVAVMLLVTWCGTGLGWNYAFARRRGGEFLLNTGTDRNPFIPCLAIRQKLAVIPARDWIYLAWPADGRGEKLREVMTLLLINHPLASNWSVGRSISPFVTPYDAKRGPGNCEWVLRYEPPQTGQVTDNALGGMILEKQPHDLQ